ncbi:MAG: Mu-like prophage major head subunit gpT [Planctomycetes bacterium ADurb.Bin126]|nr:MAG: Mu-like prophage major head subunit gpT [Planctomycetes bacterium ADurb.Bin126]
MTATITEDIGVTEDLLLSAAVDVKKMPTVTVVAYTGGLMVVGSWGPVAIDLAGLDLAGSVAILSDHDSTRRGVVGHGRAQVVDGKLIVAGTISATGPAAREIVEAARNGFPWQASVGVEVLDRRRVAVGEMVVVNGKSIKSEGSGFTLVSKGRLREVSIVSLGSDGNTAVAIAASKMKEKSMEAQVQDTEVQAQDGLDIEAAEAKRIANVAAICEKHPEIKAKAISEGWDETKAELEVLRASRPRVPVANIADRPSGIVTLEAAILSHMGRSLLGEKALGAAAMEGAALMGATSMLDLCRAALTADGVDVPRSRPEMVKAALSTYSLPTALSNVANKLLLDAYNEVPQTWRSFCAVRSTADFKPNTAIRPSFSTPLEPVAPGGELKHGMVGEWSMQYRVDTFGKMLEIDRRDIVNDDLSVFSDTAAALGRAAMRRLSDLVYETLLANAGNFFSAGNGNYMDGADSGLSFEGLAKAIMLMRTQRDDEDNDLDLKPATLLVTPELETTARALLSSEYIQRPENVPTGNSLRQAVNLEVEPRLANTAKFGAAASSKHWYLFAAPAFAAMIVAFLNGQQTPTVEYFGLDATPERLAAAWRVYHDFGTALCDPRAAVRSKGQA